MATSAQTPLSFRGTPFGLSAVLKERPTERVPVPVVLKVPKKYGGPIEAQAFPEDDARVVSMTLPRFTAPGVYKGTAVVDGVERAVVVDVEPELDVRLYPHQLTLQAHPGDLVGTDLTIVNMSNVDVDVRRVHAIGIFRQGGIERAIRQAYVADVRDGERRVDILAEALSDSHGGLLKAKVTSGSGTIAPDEVCDLAVTFEVPRGLEAGSVYTGNWELHNLVFPIRIMIAKDSINGAGEEVK